MLRPFSTEGNQEKERIDMDQEQKKGRWHSRWNNPFPVKKNRPSQSASGKAVDRDPSVQSQCLQPSQLNLLASFGLSREDLETLSHYPDDQLTPENMPLLLQAIHKSKLAPKVPVVPSNCPEKETPQNLHQCIEDETLLSADDCGGIVKKKVIDYGHKSKYGYNEAVPVVKGSSLVVNESKEGFQTPKAASGLVASPSRVTSNPKSPSKELPGQPGFQTSTPSAQAKPPTDVAPKVPPKELWVPANVPSVMQPGVLPKPKPVPAKIQPIMHPVVLPVSKPERIPVLPVKKRAMDQRPPPFAPKINKTLSSHDRFEHASGADPLSRPCQGAGDQNNFWVEEPIRSPFGVVKASWLPTFLQRDAPVIKLPTASEMDDYFAVTPKIFPHVCSLCNDDCADKMGWIQHQNTAAHMVNCRWLVRNHPGWTPDPSCLSNRHEDHKQERNQSRQCSASPSPKRSRHSDHSGHRTPSQSESHDSHRTSRARSRTPSQSRSQDSHRTSRARSRTPLQSRSQDSHRRSRARSRTPLQSRSQDSHRTSRARSRTPLQSRSQDSHRMSRARSRTPLQSRSQDSHRMSRARSRTPLQSRNRDSHRMSQARSRTRSRSRNRDSHRMSRARSRTRSRSRSRDYHRTSRARSRSPKRLSSPRHRSKSPRQSQNSRGRSSFSKERGSGSSSKSSEGQHAMAPSSRRKHDERKQTDSRSDCRERRREDSERTREDASCQKQSVDKTGSKKETHKKLVPEGQSHEEPERLALASLTEKSVLQAMAQLQAQGTAEGSLNQGGNSAELAAGVTDTSTVSSDLVSMIQRVATQVITAVLDSKEASATRARTRTRAPDPQKVSSATRKAKSQSVAPREGTVRSHEAKGKSLKRPCPKKGTSLSGKAKNKREAGLCPKADKAKNKPKAGPCHRERTSLCSKAKNAVNPGVSLGTAAKGKKENKCVAGQRSKQAVASRDKAEKESGIGFAPHQSTTERDKVENQGVVTACPQQGAPKSSKSDNQGVVIVCPQQGVPVSCTSKNQGVTGACPQQGSTVSSTSKNQDVVDVCPQQGALDSSISKTQGVAGVFPQQGAPKSSMSKNQGVAVVSPLQGASVSCMSKNQGVVGATPQRDVPESSTLKNCGMVGVCPQQGPPESCTSKKESVAGVCPQQGAPVSCTSKNQGVVIVCPQQGVPVSCTSKNQGVADACPQQGAPESSTSKSQEVVGVCPQQGTPESSLSKNQGVAGAGPNQSTPADSKSENQGMASHCLNKDTARNGQAECLHVAGCSPDRGTAGSGATENESPEVPSSQQQISLNSQDTEMKLVPGNICPRSGNVKLIAKPRVWICGDSLVVSAQKRASKTPIGSKLGLEKSIILEWQKEDSLKWIQLKPFLQNVINCHQVPDVLIIHLGEEELAHVVKYDLLSRVKGEFTLLAKLAPQLRVIWSEIIPPGVWHKEYQRLKLTQFNFEMGQLILQHGGAVIKHPQFSPKNPKLYVDKVQLSGAGLDIFLNDIKNGISAHVLQPSTASDALTSLDLVSQKVATQMSEVVLSSKGASSLQTNPSEAAVRTQPVRNEAQNSGVASPSSQPGTSGICKAEKRIVKQGLVVGSIPFFSGNVRLIVKPRVWICGDSLVVSAQKRASGTAIGSQLGLEESATLEWHGQDNLKWIQLLPFLQDLVTGCQAPNLVIVHLGEEDLAQAAKVDLVNRVRAEFTLLPKLFPRAKVIWSEIIPQGFCYAQDAYWARKRLNLALGLPLESYGGAVLKHPGISSENSTLYIDQANLSDAGLDVFLEDIKNGICAHLLQSSKAESGGLNKPTSLPPPATPGTPAGLSSVSQKVATQAREVVSSSKEASSMQTNSREATVSSQPVGNTAKNSGVASPSPQPGTFGACKEEKQDLELSLIGGNVLAPCSVTREQGTKPRVWICGESLAVSAQKLDLEKRQRGELCFTFTDMTREQVTKPRVWICGDSLVVSAQKFDLEKRQRGELDRLQQRVVVEWHGQEGLTWTQLVPTLQNLAAQGQAPDVLIIHLGQKDLLSTPWLELSRIIKTEVASLKEAFPKVRLIWSEMLPQLVCPAEGEACEAEKVLKEANLFVGELISSFGGAVIKHPETSNSFPVLKANGDGLSHIGLKLFLENIKNGIRVHVLQESGTTRPGINKVLPLFSFAPLLPPAGLGSVSQEVTLQGTQGVSFSSEVLQILSNVGDAAMSTQPAVPVFRRRNVQTFKFESPPFCSRSVRPSTKPRVWICGDSLVVSAQKRACGTAIGSQLGLEESVILEWHGQDDLKWIQLLPFVQTLVTGHQAPNVLIIHLGEEDLAQAVKDNLVNRVTREFFLLKTLFPKVRVIWSEVIPEGFWPGEEGCLERETLNCIMRKFIESHEGAVIKHCRLSSEDSKLYIDKAKLSNAGIDVFLEDIKNGICAHVSAARVPTGLDFLSQKVATQTGEGASSPEEASVMQKDTREVTVSPQTVSSENSGEASPSTQPEQSGTCKTEKQDVKQELVVKSVPPCPGSPGPPHSKPRIWIVGHAAVFLAQERAVTSGIGSQLGLEEKVVLEWHGYNGLSWVELIPLLQDLAIYYQPPDVLIIHLGENDLLYTLSVDFLIRRIKEELHLVRQLFPRAKVMWSDMMRWGSDLDKPNAVNISVGESVKHFGGAVIGHPRISSEERYFDKENLRNVGLDIFLEDIKAGICAHVLQSRGAASGRLGKGTRLPASASPAAPVARGSVSQISAIQVEEASSVQTDVGEPAVSCEAEQSSVASPSLQQGTSENQDVEEKLVPGDIPPRPGGAAVSPQPVSIKAEISGEACPSPQPGTSGTIKVEKQDEELKLVSGSALDPCSGGAAVSPQPVSIKAEISGEAGPSPPPETSRTCKTEKQDEELVSESTLDPCSGGSAVSPQPVSIKTEISGEAGPSPHPETSRTCKAEKQEVKLEPVNEDVLAPCPGNPEPASKRRVWICGQSVVTSAEKQASSTEAGSQLGLDESAILEWHGQEGLTWTQLVPTLQNLAAQGQAPDVLIIHLGEEDTECHRAAHLNDIIKKELVLVKEFFPLVWILWSNVLLRRRGCGTGGSRTVNRARTMVNQEMGHFIGTLGGAVIDHPAILHTDPDFYTDGDNLSSCGLDIFLEDMRRAILAHLHSC
ncbi:uncharacterized protein LOC125439779 isoform X3 [Sphaerodactylus townsendi]|uniref:uncharacterized protein LOC125439779 isoform X3 n=1 Tax=Sphaerodactylus townsendi TaxID=933632 RepID=UPI0020270EE5|nr:uncharacterized protein LOC125439779 isoform X3 [Sphaerodactylus townsendi]